MCTCYQYLVIKLCTVYNFDGRCVGKGAELKVWTEIQPQKSEREIYIYMQLIYITLVQVKVNRYKTKTSLYLLVWEHFRHFFYLCALVNSLSWFESLQFELGISLYFGKRTFKLYCRRYFKKQLGGCLSGKGTKKKRFM